MVAHWFAEEMTRARISTVWNKWPQAWRFSLKPMIKLTNQHLFRKGGDKNPPQISKYLRQTKDDKTIRRCRRWQVGDWGGGGKNFQLSVKGMSLVQADGNSWKGRAKHITSLLYSTKHVRSPDWPGNHRLHTADKKREMPRNKMTLWFHFLIIMFVFHIFTTSSSSFNGFITNQFNDLLPVDSFA